MSVNHSLVKFRPVLTLAQIKHIVNLTGITESPEDISIRKVLIPILAKIEVGAINPAYKISEIQLIKNQEKSERERYENGLMSAQEEMDYESKILGV